MSHTAITTDSTQTPLRHALVGAVHFFHQRGWTPATSSNFSYRLPDTQGFAISHSGIDKGSFSSADFVLVDTAGSPIEKSDTKPSAETLLHAVVYRQHPEANVILHTHSPYGTLISKHFEAQGSVRFTQYEILKGLSGIETHEAIVALPLFPNSQDMTALSRQLEATVFDYGFLLAGHGLYTWGSTVAEAKRHVEVFEFLFHCEWERLRCG